MGQGVLAAALVVSLDLVFAYGSWAQASPGDWLGAWLFATTLTLPWALLMRGLSGLGAGFWPRIPRAGNSLAVAGGALLGAWLVGGLLERLNPTSFEFPGRVRPLFDLLVLGGWVTLLVGVPWLGRWLTTRMPERARLDRGVLAGLLVCAGVVVAWSAHEGLAGVFEPRPARVLGPLALVLVVAASSLLPLTPRAARGVLGVGGVVLLLGLGWGSRSSGARYILAARSVISVPFQRLSSVDFDGDGATGRLLGGPDCAAFDAAIGPLSLEIPADGIDQDCSGGDAKPAATVTPPRDDGSWGPCLSRLQGRRLDVVLLTFDALRADALNMDLAPELAPFVSRAAWFERAYAPATSTYYSFPAIFSGLSLSDLLSSNPRTGGYVLANNPLVEGARAAGYSTRALTLLLPQGLDRGFTTFDGGSADPPPAGGAKFSYSAGSLSRTAHDELRRGAEQPRFMWVHYIDTHAPFAAIPERVMKSPKGAYQRAVRYTTLRAAALVERLLRPPLSEQTIVVLSADHGEDLGERGREGHGLDLFDSSVRVPLGLVVPGCPPLRVAQPVSLIELAPTLERLLELPSGASRSRTLVDAIAGTPRAGLPVVSEALLNGQLRRAIVHGRGKLHVDVQSGARMLFDLAQDPGELRDIHGQDLELTRELEAAYQRWLDRLSVDSSLARRREAARQPAPSPAP